MTECNHVFNYEETHCTICMKPIWQIAHDTGMNELNALKEKVDTLIHVDFSALNNAAKLKDLKSSIDAQMNMIMTANTRIKKLEDNLNELSECVLAIAKGLPPK